METPATPDPHRSRSSAATPRALIIGAVGSAILTASSLYVALKLGALPWPIVFAALASVVVLRLLGSRDLHEANVCHAAMSAGAMVAGGLAFTIPGLWILGAGQGLGLWTILGVGLAGCALGLGASRALQAYFIREKRLAYPIGTAAADTLKATVDSHSTAAPVLFGAMVVAALYAVLRDEMGVLPAIIAPAALGSIIPGVTLGVTNSPMMAAMGFTVGVTPAAVWFLGACIGTFGVGWLLPTLGLIPWEATGAWQSSLGLGLMLGVGAGTIITSLAPTVRTALRTRRGHRPGKTALSPTEAHRRLTVRPGVLALLAAAAACILCLVSDLSLVGSVLVILGTWFAVYLSAWLTGTTGVNPMEVFGVLVLLMVQVLCHGSSLEALFCGAAVVAVACGIVGDVMNDLKAGDLLDTNPKDQFLAMAVGAVVGTVVAAVLLQALLAAYGADAFGPEGTFVAAQASVVATMAGGIPQVGVFVFGLALGVVLALLGLPVMTLGLGVYLPFTMSAAAGVGALVRLVWERAHRTDDPAARAASEERWQAAASGLLGGESLMGVVAALVAVATMVWS